MELIIVETNPLIRRAIRVYLTNARYHVHEATNGEQVWNLLQQQQIPLLVATWPIPGVDGVDLLRRIRSARFPNYTYIVLLAHRNDDETLIEGIQAGADDYLIQPLNLKQLRRRIILGGRIQRLEGRLQQAQYERDSLLTRDSLCDLLNRRAIYDYAIAELTQAKHEGQSLSLVLVSIDHLREINERFGYETGDLALRRVAETIVRTVRRDDAVGRWSSTEFLVILPDTTINSAGIIAERIRGRVAATQLLSPEHSTFNISVSLGVTSTSLGLSTILTTLMHQADKALALAKHQGHNCVCQFAQS